MINNQSAPADSGATHPRLVITDHWLSLAAAPVFALLALLNHIQPDGMPAFCAAVQDGSLLTGMVPMYLMMSVLHATPWLRILKRRQAWGRTSAG